MMGRHVFPHECVSALTDDSMSDTNERRHLPSQSFLISLYPIPSEAIFDDLSRYDIPARVSQLSRSTAPSVKQPIDYCVLLLPFLSLWLQQNPE